MKAKVSLRAVNDDLDYHASIVLLFIVTVIPSTFYTSSRLSCNYYFVESVPSHEMSAKNYCCAKTST
jgi:hypothetical protein